jgi:hypothetical protein
MQFNLFCRKDRISSPTKMTTTFVLATKISIEDIEVPKIWDEEMECHDPSIMKNDVWDIVLRREGKFVMTSKWNYQIKHVLRYL